jgi:hypothetical protein
MAGVFARAKLLTSPGQEATTTKRKGKKRKKEEMGSTISFKNMTLVIT